MNKEDYIKYYIQGSDHYLIPKDVFDELFGEMVNWREESKELNKKYLNAVADYETTMSELQELKKQIEEYQKALDDTMSEKMDLEEENKKYKNQQKKFIEYLEKCINELKKESMNKLQNTINLGIVDITKEILSKYKEIIGVSDENNMGNTK